MPLNKTYPWKTSDKTFGFRARLSRKQVNLLELLQPIPPDRFFNHPKLLIDGARLMFHDVNEIPFKTNQVYYAPFMNTTDFIVTPDMDQIDDSLMGFTPEE